IWDLANRNEKAKLKGHKGTVRAVAFSPSGQFVASAGEDQAVKLWDVAGLKERSEFGGNGPGVSSLAFSSRGRLLVGGCLDGTVRIWDVVQGRERSRLRAQVAAGPPMNFNSFGGGSGTLQSVGTGVSAVAFASNGRMLVSSGYDKTIKLWPAKSSPPVPL